MFYYPWYSAVMLAFEAGNVIDKRIWKIARGGTDGVAESCLMVSEKVHALFEAGSVLVRGGNSAQVIDMYRKHVAANALRLGPAREQRRVTSALTVGTADAPASPRSA
jgi:hypothetical protein